jgi:hypothetical protein
MTCIGRKPAYQAGAGKHYLNDRDSLSHPRRLILDLCVKVDGNVLWVTAILDTICERLAGGQKVPEVMRCLVDLPEDVEDYYHDLVFTRVHSTYRKGKVSECAIALKIVDCFDTGINLEWQRFEVVWALQTTISAGSGIAHDAHFFAKPPSARTGRPIGLKAYQAVCEFVRSRCKDLLITIYSPDKKLGYVDYQHRVILEEPVFYEISLAVDRLVETAHLSLCEEKVNFFGKRRITSFLPHMEVYRRLLVYKLQEATYKQYKQCWKRAPAFICRTSDSSQQIQFQYSLNSR